MAHSGSCRREIIAASLIVVVSLFMILATFANMNASPWEIREEGFLQSSFDLALVEDSEGVLHSAYRDHMERLIYAQFKDGNWEAVPIANVTSDYHGMSIALGTENEVFICTAEISSGVAEKSSRVLFASNELGSWNVSDVPLNGLCSSSAVAVDAYGTVHMICSEYYGYYDGTPEQHGSRLRHLVRGPNGWENSTVATFGLGDLVTVESFRIDSSNGLHLLIIHDNRTEAMYNWNLAYSRLCYLSSEDNDWSLTVISNRTGAYTPGYPSMVVDGLRPHISFFQYLGDVNRLHYATKIDGAWSATDVAWAGTTVFVSSSIDVGVSGNAVIGYQTSWFDGASTSNGTVRYAVQSSNGWRTSVVDTAIGGHHESRETAIAAGPDNVPDIIYCDTSDGPPTFCHARGLNDNEVLLNSVQESALYSGLVALLVVCPGGLIAYKILNTKGLKK